MDHLKIQVTIQGSVHKPANSDALGVSLRPADGKLWSHAGTLIGQILVAALLDTISKNTFFKAM